MTEQGHERLDSQLAKQIRAEITAQLARWVVAAIAALIVAAVLGWWFYLYPIIVTIIGVPPGTVAAFDTSAGRCPDGWQPLHDAAGRTIVGANMGGPDNVDQGGAHINLPPFRQIGGFASVSLSRANLPSIPVEIPWHFSNANFGTGGYKLIRYLGNQPGADGEDRITIEAGGQAAPIGNLTPYLALTICRKGGA